MPLATPIHPGKVDWTGENPGILLKETADGPWSAMALFFRIAWSPAGRGQVLVLYEDPNSARSLPDTANVVLHDNRALADFLVGTFVARLAAFAGAAAFPALDYRELDSVQTQGDPRRRYSEHLRAGDQRRAATERRPGAREPPRADERDEERVLRAQQAAERGAAALRQNHRSMF